LSSVYREVNSQLDAEMERRYEDRRQKGRSVHLMLYADLFAVFKGIKSA